MQFLAWGNNLTGNLDPQSKEGIISSPEYVFSDLEIEEISWSSWACTIGRVRDSYFIWGSGTSGDDKRLPKRLSLSSTPIKFLGADEPSAYLDKEGYVHALPDDGRSATSSKTWRDVALTGLGSVYALSDDSLSSFDNFDDFMSCTNSSEIKHPILDPQSPLTLYATESRVLALSNGPLGHVLEFDYKGSVKLVEDLEGLGVETVIAGSANRLAVVTEAGDAYLINRRTLEPELVEIEDESAVRYFGVGSKHEIVVTEENVWVRGENNFSQLGIEGETREDFVKLPCFTQEMVKHIRSVHCGRWSNIVVMHS